MTQEQLYQKFIKQYEKLEPSSEEAYDAGWKACEEYYQKEIQAGKDFLSKVDGCKEIRDDYANIPYFRTHI